ncbi:acyl-phosphate--sn-glycerol-3-phosphate 1-O-acyltransferase [Geotalea daltonii FRC-32]|uniref:Glycerol-3-phosphate acyltransferase n=1 Tax=Geotalea daltonii (strain DSM 22248 / JCM 15807 / FRC-32) TaxID=316067 RepID=PLSY_GEODF|nr:glycerol-3-phosphate 1-O-acyltransferase PlsY [Geotalea daltonii]B9M1A8.1 RecName: Full=Glycerol-3-phosphate acyltransferase; AltName: Full=Acyl-PO4 G3P acyltransferase; AltName: Full=Acyl-phosphate--glycerol-3-phosphate acyltransferase; AltName: Full=G3P acyltransferase; Short=GPAT; AltName: Full=Lysophosphatidic acid synthase; Short=LPA synthase [Geotalea daltonii FRC-32]ACM19178.1 acyl-phosphate--sn-glycerol-3-phosphate 1-O-acyltransferase [Geotalea daltonii FRC-32]
MTSEIVLIIGAYLLGSIPTGLLLAKAVGVDIRTTGSGNIGATNVYRTLGRRVGIMTLIGDCLKGLIPVLIARHLQLPEIWVAATGLAAFLGHVYTVFLRFKGGKGVATALGVFIGISPLSVLAALAIFVFTLIKWRYVSLASITAAAAIPFLVALIEKKGLLITMSVIIAALVVFKHRENIRRLRSGTENVFKR